MHAQIIEENLSIKSINIKLSKCCSQLFINSNATFHVKQGKDSIIFFLDIKDNFSPIGFIRTTSPVTTILWSDTGDGAGDAGQGEDLLLLVCCEDGTMMEVNAPIKGQHDTSKTFFLDPLKFTVWKFATIKDRLRVSRFWKKKSVCYARLLVVNVCN